MTKADEISDNLQDEQERKRLEEAYVEKRNREKYLSNASEVRYIVVNGNHTVSWSDS